MTAVQDGAIDGERHCPWERSLAASLVLVQRVRDPLAGSGLLDRRLVPARVQFRGDDTATPARTVLAAAEDQQVARSGRTGEVACSVEFLLQLCETHEAVAELQALGRFGRQSGP